MTFFICENNSQLLIIWYWVESIDQMSGSQQRWKAALFPNWQREDWVHPKNIIKIACFEVSQYGYSIYSTVSCIAIQYVRLNFPLTSNSCSFPQCCFNNQLWLSGNICSGNVTTQHQKSVKVNGAKASRSYLVQWLAIKYHYWYTYLSLRTALSWPCHTGLQTNSIKLSHFHVFKGFPDYDTYT